jgi:pyruvate/2-oxoglutarate dehydrogenase complex dihydrolipoamide acyltransferase (E2) component
MNVRPIARQRRHTLYFLRGIRSFAPVFLDTEVDMSGVRAQRESSTGQRYSYVSYVLWAAGRALAAHPEANAAIRGGIRPRVARYDHVDAKLTLDAVLDGHRVVLTGILPGVDTADLAEIQRQVAHHRDLDHQTAPEFARVRALHRIPWPFGPLLFRLASAPLSRRPGALGTVAVTSLGHGPVDSFHSIGGTTITLGVGRVIDRPVVRDGQVVVAPVMRLSLTFDHRVIDGAEAADVLAAIRDRLEHVDAPATAEAR